MHSTVGRRRLRIWIRVALVSSIAAMGAEWARALAGPSSQQDGVDVAFSTYLGGTASEQVHDVTSDAEGNTYVVGGTNSADFPLTQKIVTSGSPESTAASPSDVFVTKYDSSGRVVWSTLIGGPNHDEASAIELDQQGFIYIAGAAGKGFPVTLGALQTVFLGGSGGAADGNQDGFVLKLKPDGSQLVWSGYVGGPDAQAVQDLDVDALGNVYVVCGYTSGSYPPALAAAFAMGAQPLPKGGTDLVVGKIDSTGSKLVWATYLGGSGDESTPASIRVDASGAAHILAMTTSKDIVPAGASAYDRTANGGVDLYAAKISPDGSNLEFATYLGGSLDEVTEAHGLALDGKGNAYIVAGTKSSGYPTTLGVVQEQFIGGVSDLVLSRLSGDGTKLLASTFLGGRGSEAPGGVAVDSHGTVYVGGTTESGDYPITVDALASRLGGISEGVLTKMTADLTQLLYSTYIGGHDRDTWRALAVNPAGHVAGAGDTQSVDWPTQRSSETRLAGGVDAFIVDLSPIIPPPFSVNAGSDQAIVLSPSASGTPTPAEVTLHGALVGPEAAKVTKTIWAKVGGGGSMTFANPQALDTTASISTPDTYLLRLSATDGTLLAEDDVVITVGAPNASSATSQTEAASAGLTLTFTATPDIILLGESSVLEWNAPGATSCQASVNGRVLPNPQPASRQVNVSPTATTTFALTCTDAGGGSVTGSVTITVNIPPAPTLTFTATPATIILGESTQLQWDAPGATGCTATVNGRPLANPLPASSGGPVALSPTVTTTYELTCTGPGGSVAGSQTVTIQPPALTLSATPDTIGLGETSVLAWAATGATECRAEVNGRPLANVVPTSAQVSVSPPVTTTFALTCTGPSGSVTKSVTVTLKTPTLMFTAAPETIAPGDTSVLSWSTTNVDSCSATANGISLGPQPTSNQLSVAPQATTIYALTCTGAGSTLTQSVTVVVTTIPTVTFGQRPPTIDNESVTSLDIPVTIQVETEFTVTVPYTVSGTAEQGAGKDYTIQAGPLVFNPRERVKYIHVDVNPDALNEDDETVAIRLEAPTNAELGNPSELTYTIRNDDPTPTVGFFQPLPSDQESRSSVDVSVRLSAQSGKTVTVFFTVGGNAVGTGTDYSLTTASPMVFAPRDTEKLIHLDIVQDNSDEDNEQVTLALTSPINANLSTSPTSPTGHTYTIVDDDPIPVIRFDLARSPTAWGEFFGPRDFTVVLQPASGKTVSVPFTVGGDATGGGVDYTLATASPLTFAPGETEKTIHADITPDRINEPDERIAFLLQDPLPDAANQATGRIDPATAQEIYTILDDDSVPTVFFDSADGKASEATAPAPIVVKLSGPSGRTITVPFSVDPTSTATGGGGTGIDYLVGTASPLTFAPGETQKTITLSVLDDVLDEGDEFVKLTFQPPTDASPDQSRPTTYTYTILDDDTGSTTHTLRGRVVRSDGAPLPGLSVALKATPPQTSPSPVTTNSNGDYVFSNVPSGIYDIVPGATGFTVTPTTQRLDLTNQMGSQVPIPLFTGVLPVASFDPSSPATASESAGGVELAMVLSFASDREIRIPYAPVVTQASPNEDFIAPAGTLVFPVGSTRQAFRVTIVQDVPPVDEPDEDVRFRPQTAPGVTVVAADHLLTIQDDDPTPSVAFAATNPARVAEGSSAAVNVTLSGASSRTVVVTYALGGSATAGTCGTCDYTVAPTPAIVFNPLETQKPLTVSARLDALDEPNEDITMTLGDTPQNAILGSPGNHQLIISGNAQSISGRVVWGSGVGVSGVAMKLLSAFGGSLVAQTTTDLNGDYRFSNVRRDSYELFPESTGLTFRPSSRSFDVLSQDVTLSPFTVSSGTQPTVSFVIGSAIQDESVASVPITVTLSGQPNDDVVVPFRVSGTAKQPDDYTITLPTGQTGSQLVFYPGDPLTKNITVNVVQDPRDELDETVQLALGIPINAQPGAIVSHTYTIRDDDLAPFVTFNPFVNPMSGAETAGAIPLKVVISPPTGRASVAVPLVVTGDAISGSDYTLSPSSQVVFREGEIEQIITLTVLDNATQEPDKRVILDLNPGSDARRGLFPTHTFTLVDDDRPAVSFATATSQANEGTSSTSNPSVNLVVNLSGQPAIPIVVPYVLTGGSATNGSLTVQGNDFDLANGSLTFSPALGETTKSIVIPIRADSADEPDETFEVSLRASTTTTFGPTGIVRHTHTITDDDPTPSIGFSASTSQGNEATATAQATVTLAPASGRTVTIDYAVAGGTATGGTALGTGVDYVIPTVRTLTFNPGDTSKTISIPINSTEAVNEANETIIVDLSNPTNASTSGRVTRHTYTILDDDAPPTVTFSRSSSSGAESETPARLAVVLVGNTTQQQVTARYAVTGLTANGNPGPDQDFIPRTGTLVFNPGTRALDIQVDIANNQVEEPDETLKADLTSSTVAPRGSITTHTYTIRNDDVIPPRITSTLGDQTVSLGARVTFSITVTGSNPLTYRWQRNQADIPGAPSQNSYTIPSADLVHAGSYRCIVSNPSGSDTSNEATLVVNW